MRKIRTALTEEEKTCFETVYLGKDYLNSKDQNFNLTGNEWVNSVGSTNSTATAGIENIRTPKGVLRMANEKPSSSSISITAEPFNGQDCWYAPPATENKIKELENIIKKLTEEIKEMREREQNEIVFH